MRPLARIRELFEDCYQHSPNKVMILDANETIVDRASPTLEQTKQGLIDANVTHFNESGLRDIGVLPEF